MTDIECRLVAGYIGCLLFLMGLSFFAAILWMRFRSTREAYEEPRDCRPAYTFSGVIMLTGMGPVERYFMPHRVWMAVPLWWHLFTEMGFIVALVGVALVYETSRLHYLRCLDS